MSFETRFLYYVQMLDSALPIGGFSHSFGLETYVQNGKVSTMEDLEDYVLSQIHNSWVRLEGLAIKGMYTAIANDDMWSLGLYDKIIHVQRTPLESRQGLHKMGKRLLRLAKSLYPFISFSELESSIKEYGIGTLPTIHAWIAYHLELPVDDAVKGYLYSSVVMVTNSALRLMSIGQTDGQMIIRRAIPVIEEEWKKIRDLPVEQLHSFSVAQEIRSMNHEILYSRLFMS
ncbi:urease accessory protein UreF [Ferviditalea candida]|uniref:Urease accessory protein UreF n=1 Tax=Ferviditalea candida TaxID=3108399 RepID=A0ABU5ZLI0_9BACL|nr:urease accessory UreF family protein [Paenibacillaceae bacterium T2]